MKENVAILGASDNEDRYSYKALQLLQQYHHQVFPVHPSLQVIERCRVFPHLKDISARIDTLTVYVRSEVSKNLGDEIIQLKPRRVIFNPGAENSALASRLEKAGILVENACTLVLLRTNQFESY